jgi:raffinose/stachyose/melibiose transport system permease protein
MTTLTSPRRAPRVRGPRKPIVGSIVVWVWAIISLFPLLWIAVQSLRPDIDFLTKPWSLPTLESLSIEPYIKAFTGARMGSYLMNSGIVVAAVVALAIVIATLGGYALSQLQFAGKRLVTGLIFTAMIIPASILLLPRWLVTYELGLLDTKIALIIPYTAFTVPLCIILMRGAFDGLPQELFAAARIDGASEWAVFWRVALPLVPGMIATVGFLVFMPVWEEYLWAFITLQSRENYTVPIGLQALSADRTQFGYNVSFASMVIAASPVIIALIVTQRRFFTAITAGAVKG